MSKTLRKVEHHGYNGFQCEGVPKDRYMDYLNETQWYKTDKSSNATLNKFYAKTVPLLIPDENGICHDSMMLADQFAQAGLTTWICGYTDVSEPPEARAKAYNAKPQNRKYTEKEAEKIVDDTVKNIVNGNWPKASSNPKVKRIVLAGFGLGAKHVLRLLVNTETKGFEFVAGFIASPEGAPSCTLEAFTTVKVPLSIAFADYPQSKTDAKERDKIRAAMQVWNGPYQINIFSHVRDGFALRRAAAGEPEKFVKRQAFVQAIQWFNCYLFEDNVKQK